MSIMNKPYWFERDRTSKGITYRESDGMYVVTDPDGLDFGWFVVPYGFESDGDTMPELVRAFWDTEGLRDIRILVAIGHDFLYKTKCVSRREADMFYRETLLQLGFPDWRAYVEWFWIRALGWWCWYLR